MKFLFGVYGLLAIIFNSSAQDRVRIRKIDYTQYDQLMSAIGYAPDKLKAAKRLLDVSDALFSSEDEEYFSTRKIIAIYYEMAHDTGRAIELLQQAMDAYEKNFPFYNRGYPTVTKEYASFTYLDLARYSRMVNLFEKSINYLESKRVILECSTAYYARQQFYNEYAQSLLGAERYEEAVTVGLKFKELTESGALIMDSKSAEEIFKINPSDSKEVREQMQKSKEQYIKAIKQSQESIISGQRLSYNMVLGNAYYNQYKFAESVPYLKATSDEMKKLMDYSRKAMADAAIQIAEANIPDSLKSMTSESAAYINQIAELGGPSTLLVIAASKSGQPALAARYATGQVEKAVLFQLKNEWPSSEEQYQTAFATMNDLSKYKFMGSSGEQMRKGFLPLYLNLEVQSGKLDYAYNESKKVLLEEEVVLRKNFQFFSESEKKEFFKSYNQKLERFYSLLFLMTENNNDRAGELLDKILQTKGVILDVTMAQEKLLKKIKDRITIEQIRKSRKLRDKLAAFYQLSLKSPNPAITDSINRNSIRINELERKINEKIGVIADLLKPVSWKDVQGKLKPEEVYFEILRLQRYNFSFDKPVVQYWAFVVKPGISRPVLFRLSEGEAFEGRGLKNYQNRIRNQLDDLDSYKTYWADLNKQLDGVSKVILSGDGVYHVINPLTLKNPQTGKYVLNEISLTRVSTGRDLLNAAPFAPPNREIALIGNPEFAMSRKGNMNQFQGNEFEAVTNDGPVVRSGMTELPGTLKEVESIQSMAMNKGMRTNILAGAQATEASVKTLKNQQILHLATHGEFDQYSKADSYLKAKLILAGAADAEPFTINDYSKYEDGFLTAYEVTQLALSQTNLVVLSACETSTGEIQSGEGVWGLQRAFQLAGAKTVMGSLWKISDEATVVFMEAFYQKYFSGASISNSYNAAMEATMIEYPHPYYWGAFTLTGVN